MVVSAEGSKMNRNIYIISTGIGGLDLLTKKGENLIRDMDILAGYPQLKNCDFGKPFYETKNIEELKALSSMFSDGKIGVLVSGDAGFYSFAKKIYIELKDQIADVVPGVSTFQYALAKIFETYEDVKFYSLHSQDDYGQLKDLMRSFRKIFIILKDIKQAKTIAEMVDLKNSKLTFFADLNTANEIITDRIDDLEENCKKIAVFWRKDE